MTFIVALTKPTIDIFDAESVDDFEFHSAYDTLKYEAQGTKTVVTDRSDYYDSDPGYPPFIPPTYYYYTVETIEHGLEYIPYFAGYFNVSSTTACQCPWAYGGGGYFGYQSVYADDTYLYFVTHFNSSLSPTGTVDSDFSYRIFKNDIGL